MAKVAHEVWVEFDLGYRGEVPGLVRETLRDETVDMRTGMRYGQERVIVNTVPLCRCA